jgi:hypothetical protein
MEFREEWGCVNCMQLAVERLQWRIGVNTLLIISENQTYKVVLPAFQVQVLIWAGGSGSNPERALCR